MDNNQHRFVLEELQFSADLPQDVLEQLAVASTIERKVAGETVFNEGGNNHFLYLVRSGCTALEINIPGRGPARILTVGPGEMFGWSSVLNQGQMTTTAIAVVDSEFVVAPAEKLIALCETNLDFGYHFMKRMAGALSKRLVATRLQLLDLFADQTPNGDL